MSAYAEFIGKAFIVRIGPEASKYGDPYNSSVVFKVVDGETIEGLGVDRQYTKQDHRDAFAALVKEGFKYCNVTRVRKDGRIVRRKIKLTK